MRFIDILFIISIIFSIMSLPFGIGCFFYLQRFRNEEFLRIRGVKMKIFLLCASSTLLPVIHTPTLFVYYYTLYNDFDSDTDRNKNNKTDKYFLVVYEMIILFLATFAFMQRVHDFSKLKIKS